MAETKSLDGSGGPVLPTCHRESFQPHSSGLTKLCHLLLKAPAKDLPLFACFLILKNINNSGCYYGTRRFAIGPLPVASCLIPLQPTK